MGNLILRTICITKEKYNEETVFDEFEQIINTA